MTLQDQVALRISSEAVRQVRFYSQREQTPLYSLMRQAWETLRDRPELIILDSSELNPLPIKGGQQRVELGNRSTERDFE